MISLEDALKRLHYRLDRATLEHYIARRWVRPVVRDEAWQFEEIDLASIQLVHHLHRDMLMQDDAMDVALNLLDQLYAMRERMRLVEHAIRRQPHEIQQRLVAVLEEE